MQLEFAAVYDREVYRVYGFFAYRLNDRGDAEDLTQLTFEHALRSWPRYDPRRAAPSTWLLAIARNLLIDHFRAGSRRIRSTTPLDEDVLERVPADEDTSMSLGVSPELAEALATLTARDREILALRFGADLSGPEIAEICELSLANVQQILSRSLRRLRSELEGTDLER